MKRILCVASFLVTLGIGNAITYNVQAQSNAELLEMMQAMRQQINAQQKQLEAMEKELERRSEIVSTPTKPFEAEAASPVMTSARGIGDSYIGAFVGGAFMLDTDTTLTRFFQGDPFLIGPFVNKGKDAVVESSPLVGAKGGLCPAFFFLSLYGACC